MCKNYTYHKNMCRKWIFLYIFLFSTICFSQKDSICNLNIKLKAVRYSSAFIAGFAEGTMDAISFHYDKFQKVHPNASPQFWDPSLSWKNKWYNGNPNEGEKFLGSSTFLVWTTDGWHALKAVNRLTTIGGSIVITIGEKKKWTYYAKELLISYAANRAGFYTSYNLIYK